MFANRVKETTTTIGTGTINLLGAATGFRTFVSGIGTGKKCYYNITNGVDWEIGVGSVTSGAPDTLSRSPIYSSNANNLVNFPAGTKNVFIPPESNALRFGSVGQIPTTTGSANAQVAAFFPAVKFLQDGMIFSVRAGFTNTAALTLQLDAFTALTVKRGAAISDLVAGDWVTGETYMIMYDSTSSGRLILLNSKKSGDTNGPWTSVASAATTNIGAVNSENVLITGTTTITAFDNVLDGITREVRFGGALTLTHNATSLQLPGNANIVTVAGDRATFASLGSGNWICLNYERGNGLKISNTNVVSGASAINFGQTNLGYYEQGTWTPVDASGAGLSFTIFSANYTRIGNLVYVQGHIGYPVTANAAQVTVGGLPFAVGNYATAALETNASISGAIVSFRSGASTLQIYTIPEAGVANSTIGFSGNFILFSGVYKI